MHSVMHQYRLAARSRAYTNTRLMYMTVTLIACIYIYTRWTGTDAHSSAVNQPNNNMMLSRDTSDYLDLSAPIIPTPTYRVSVIVFDSREQHAPLCHILEQATRLGYVVHYISQLPTNLQGKNHMGYKPYPSYDLLANILEPTPRQITADLYMLLDGVDVYLQVPPSVVYERWLAMNRPEFMVSGESNVFPHWTEIIDLYPPSTDEADVSPYVNAGMWLATRTGVIEVMTALYDSMVHSRYPKDDQWMLSKLYVHNVTHGLLQVDKRSQLFVCMQRNDHSNVDRHRSVHMAPIMYQDDRGYIRRKDARLGVMDYQPVAVHYNGGTKKWLNQTVLRKSMVKFDPELPPLTNASIQARMSVYDANYQLRPLEYMIEMCSSHWAWRHTV